MLNFDEKGNQISQKIVRLMLLPHMFSDIKFRRCKYFFLHEKEFTTQKNLGNEVNVLYILNF